jgi:hypothetical protein
MLGLTRAAGPFMLAQPLTPTGLEPTTCLRSEYSKGRNTHLPRLFDSSDLVKQKATAF